MILQEIRSFNAMNSEALNAAQDHFTGGLDRQTLDQYKKDVIEIIRALQDSNKYNLRLSRMTITRTVDGFKLDTHLIEHC